MFAFDNLFKKNRNHPIIKHSRKSKLSEQLITRVFRCALLSGDRNTGMSAEDLDPKSYICVVPNPFVLSDRSLLEVPWPMPMSLGYAGTEVVDRGRRQNLATPLQAGQHKTSSSKLCRALDQLLSQQIIAKMFSMRVMCRNFKRVSHPQISEKERLFQT